MDRKIIEKGFASYSSDGKIHVGERYNGMPFTTFSIGFHCSDGDLTPPEKYTISKRVNLHPGWQTVYINIDLSSIKNEIRKNCRVRDALTHHGSWCLSLADAAERGEKIVVDKSMSSLDLFGLERFVEYEE